MPTLHRETKQMDSTRFWPPPTLSTVTKTFKLLLQEILRLHRMNSVYSQDHRAPMPQSASDAA